MPPLISTCIEPSFDGASHNICDPFIRVPKFGNSLSKKTHYIIYRIRVIIQRIQYTAKVVYNFTLILLHELFINPKSLSPCILLPNMVLYRHTYIRNSDATNTLINVLYRNNFHNVETFLSNQRLFCPIQQYILFLYLF